MQREWRILDDRADTVLATVLADSAQDGATLELAPQWHSPAHLDRYANVLTEAALWLRESAAESQKNALK